MKRLGVVIMKFTLSLKYKSEQKIVEGQTRWRSGRELGEQTTALFSPHFRPSSPQIRESSSIHYEPGAGTSALCQASWWRLMKYERDS